MTYERGIWVGQVDYARCDLLVARSVVLYLVVTISWIQSNMNVRGSPAITY